MQPDGFTPPEGEFLSIDAGIERTCALRTNLAITCWGGWNSGHVTTTAT